MRYEERAPVELAVEGKIPVYAAGTLFRTGIGPREVATDPGATFRVNHWFDSFAQVHRFQIHPPTSDRDHVRVTYNSRLTCDGVIERVQRTGKYEGYTFGTKYDLCTTYFQKLKSFFTPVAPAHKADEVNQSVTVSANLPGLTLNGERSNQGVENKKISTLCNRTDGSSFQMLDPQTLEPIGLAEQKTLHPELKGPCSATHAKSDPITGDVFNYNLEISRTGIYRVFTVSASTGKTSILATVHAEPSYVHSSFLTDNYVVLCVWNAFFTWSGASVFFYMNFVDAFAPFDESKPAEWFVIDRLPPELGGKGLVATYKSSSFFAFHAVNAYEEITTTEQGASVNIIADVVAYDTNACVKSYFLDNIMSDSPTARTFRDPKYADCRSSIRRFKLEDVPAEPTGRSLRAHLLFSRGSDLSIELPVINPSKLQKEHRYIYGVTETGKASFFDGLVKYDTRLHRNIQWSRQGQTAAEPIFVADPEGVEEDDGILLSVVLDGVQGKSYLLVLDARNMEEIGRANVDGPVGFGFHGSFVGKEGTEKALQF